jgi:cytochrome b561
MFRHKSLGLLTGMIVAPRLAYRLVNRSSVRIPDRIMILLQSSTVKIQNAFILRIVLY